jgi:uncharacterized membrane protein
MNKKKISVCIVITLLIGFSTITMSTVAFAQSNETESETQTETPEETSITKISDSVTLTNYEFNGDKITITVKAAYSQNLVLSDMYVKGTGAQQIPRKEILLDSGKNKINFTVTSWNGYKGVVIASGSGAIAISEETSGGGLDATITSNQYIPLAIGSVIMGIGLTGVVAYKRKMDMASNVEREY